jgi:hypothetical protein
VRSGKRSERPWQQERVLAVHGHGALGSSAWPSLQHAAVRKASRGCTDGLALRRAAGWVGPSPSPWVRWGHGHVCGAATRGRVAVVAVLWYGAVLLPVLFFCFACQQNLVLNGLFSYCSTFCFIWQFVSHGLIRLKRFVS